MNERGSSALFGRQATLGGWGRTHRSECFAIQASDDALLRRTVDPRSTGALPGPVIARGGGNSYGDAATSRGGTVIDMRHRRRLLELDVRAGLLVVEAGFTLGQAVDLSLAHGWLPPVLPGSRHVTLGGAVAADVHGKNHPQVGSIGRHLAWLEVLSPLDEDPRVLSPSDRPVEFWATVGGLGLTGVITVVALRLRPVDGSARTSRRRGTGLGEVMDLMQADHSGADELTDVHSVAWLDSTAPSARTGRGVVQTTRVGLRRVDREGPSPTPHPSEDGHTVTAEDHASPPGRTSTPRHNPSQPGVRLVGRATIPLANHAQWLLSGSPRGASRAGRSANLPDCLFPLRNAERWPALFGRRGLVQYQFAVPHDRDDVIIEALDLLRRRRMPPALTSLKRLGPADRAPLSFARPGWTVAMDLPAAWSGLADTLDELDGLVADADGRIYLAKDSRLTAPPLARMYPELQSWQRTRDTMDPSGVLGSDLSVRLGLTSVRQSSAVPTTTVRGRS